MTTQARYGATLQAVPLVIWGAAVDHVDDFEVTLLLNPFDGNLEEVELKSGAVIGRASSGQFFGGPWKQHSEQAEAIWNRAAKYLGCNRGEIFERLGIGSYRVPVIDSAAFKASARSPHQSTEGAR